MEGRESETCLSSKRATRFPPGPAASRAHGRIGTGDGVQTSAAAAAGWVESGAGEQPPILNLRSGLAKVERWKKKEQRPNFDQKQSKQWAVTC
jgi:hypothetical protein